MMLGMMAERICDDSVFYVFNNEIQKWPVSGRTGILYAALRQARPDIDLYWQDGAHTSPYGAYAAAACFARLLCRAAPLAPLSETAWAFSPIPGAAGGFHHVGSELVSLDREQTRAILAAVEAAIPLG